MAELRRCFPRSALQRLRGAAAPGHGDAITQWRAGAGQRSADGPDRLHEPPAVSAARSKAATAASGSWPACAISQYLDPRTDRRTVRAVSRPSPNKRLIVLFRTCYDV